MPTSTFSIRAYEFLSEQELLTLRGLLLTQINSDVNGTVVESVNTSGLSTTFFQSSGTPAEQLRAVTWALQKMNPSVYGNSLTKIKRSWVV